MQWPDKRMFIRGEVHSSLTSPAYLRLFFQMPSPSWGWLSVPLFSSIARAPLPWWLLPEPFSMSFATILTCPSVAVLFDDLSVSKLPCLGFRLLHDSTPTFSLLYPFDSIFLPTLLFIYLFIFKFIYLFLFWAVLGLRCCAGSSLVLARGVALQFVVHGLLIALASLGHLGSVVRLPGSWAQARELWHTFSCSKAYIEPPGKPLSFSWFFN